MKKYVFTIKDDVCAANGKDIEATELLAKMRLWGDVEDYEKATAAERAEYQATIDGLTAQLSDSKSLMLNGTDEIRMIDAYRACKKEIDDASQARIGTLELQLESTKADYLKKAEQISALLVG